MQEELFFKSTLQHEDYNHTTIHLAWYLNDKQRFLLFGFLELLPNEFSKPSETGEISKRIGNKDRRHVWLRRFVIPINRALQWYECCQTGKVFLPEDDWETSPEPKILQILDLAQEPNWPHLNTTIEDENLPFVPNYHICPRVHHLIPTAHCEELEKLKLEKLNKEEKIVLDWLSEQFYFNFRDYPEYFGSLHLIAPNPVFRRFEKILRFDFDQEISKEKEAVIYHFMPRCGYSVEGLQLMIIEERATEIAALQYFDIQSNILKINYYSDSVIERIATAVVCPQRGVLYCSGALPFIRDIQFNSEVTTIKKEITVPVSQSRQEFNYEVPVKEKAFSLAIKSHRQQHSKAIAISVEGKKQRKKKQEDKRFGQKWFGAAKNETEEKRQQAQKEAEEFIRNLISEAKKQVIIVDPYFGVRELFNFALATTSSRVQVNILSSSEALKQKDKEYKQYEIGVIMLMQLENPELKQLGSKISIKVMPGDSPEIHDRFLVIDDQVWLSGNSLNEIGSRASVIVKLPEPESIQQNIQCVLSRSDNLETWVRNRNNNKKS